MCQAQQHQYIVEVRDSVITRANQYISVLANERVVVKVINLEA